MGETNYIYFKAIFLGALFIMVRFALQFDGLYGQDAYEYLRYTNEMYSFFVNQTALGDYFWGLGYPFFGSIFNFFVHDGAMALQLVSLTALLITWNYIDKIIALIYTEKPNYWVSFLFFVFSPIVLVQSFLVMSDLLACCFTTMAIYYFIQFIIQSQNKHCILGVIFSVLSFQTRYASIIVLLLFFILVFIKLVRLKNFKMMLFSIFIAAVILLPHIYIRSNNSLKFLSHNLLTEWNLLNLFKRSFTTVDGESQNKFINLIYCLFSFYHPQFFGFGIIFFGIVFKNKLKLFIVNKFQNIIFVTILFYALFVGGIPFQHKRLLLATLPLVIIMLYPVLKQIIENTKWKNYIMTMVLVSQFCFSFYYGELYYHRNKLEKAIANDLIGFPGKTIYVFDMDLALKGRNVPLDYQNIWYKEYSSFNKDALVLVNAAQLEKQWIDKNPLINWNKLKANNNLKVLKSYGDGWNLYQIQ